MEFMTNKKVRGVVAFILSIALLVIGIVSGIIFSIYYFNHFESKRYVYKFELLEMEANEAYSVYSNDDSLDAKINAMKHYLNALKLYSESPLGFWGDYSINLFDVDSVLAMTSLGKLYEEIGEHELSERYYNMALSMLEKENISWKLRNGEGKVNDIVSLKKYFEQYESRILEKNKKEQTPVK